MRVLLTFSNHFIECPSVGPFGSKAICGNKRSCEAALWWNLETLIGASMSIVTKPFTVSTSVAFHVPVSFGTKEMVRWKSRYPCNLILSLVSDYKHDSQLWCNLTVSLCKLLLILCFSCSLGTWTQCSITSLPTGLLPPAKMFHKTWLPGLYTVCIITLKYCT